MNNRLRFAEDSLPLLLKGTEVAEMLGVSRALAYRWMASNTLPVVRVPGSRSTRVPRTELLRWITANTQQPTA
jgi:excisionase family DNA binding protein